MKGWVLRAYALAFFAMVPVQAVRPMVSYRALELGGGAFDLGVIAGTYGLLSFLLAVPIGRRVDRVGEPPFLITGSVLVAVTALLLTTASSIPALFVAQATLGLGQVIGLIGMQALLSKNGEPAGRDSRIAGFTVATALAQMAGPAAAGQLYDLFESSIVRVFLVAGLFAIIAIVLAATLALRPAPREPGAATSRPVQGSIRSAVGTVLGTPTVPHALLAGMAVLITIDLMIAYLPAYGESIGLPVATVGLLLSVQASGTLLARLLMSKLIGILGRRRLLVGCMFLPSVGLFVLPFATAAPVLFLIVGVAGFGLGLGQPLSLAWVVSRMPNEIRGTAIGVRLTANRFGQFVIPIGIGAMGSLAGISAIFLVSGGLLATSALTFASAAEEAEPEP